MSCSFEEDLTAYVDGELPELRRRAVELHLGSCPSCPVVVKLLEVTVKGLSAMPAFAPSQGLRRQVLAQLDEPGGWVDRVRAIGCARSSRRAW
jgi:anti-sigma factor RsiW